MPSYRDPNGKIWRLPDTPRARKLASRQRELDERIAGNPGTDPETIRRALDELAGLARDMIDVVFAPIELLRSAPVALLIGGALYLATRAEHNKRSRRR